MDKRVSDFLAEARRHRQAFERLCGSLDDRELAQSVPRSIWTVKGYIAHLATIDLIVQRWLETLLEAEGSGVALHVAGAAAHTGFDVDEWNEAHVAERDDWALDRILDEMHGNRSNLEAVAERLTPEILDGLLYFPGDRDRAPADVNVGLYLQGLAWHDPIHAVDILRALPGRVDDPELSGWLGPLARMAGSGPGGQQ